MSREEGLDKEENKKTAGFHVYVPIPEKGITLSRESGLSKKENL